jgi:hypothetical protein
VLLLYGAGMAHDDSRHEMELTEVRPAILRLLGVEEPSVKGWRVA